MDFVLKLWLGIVPNYANEFLQIILISTLIGSLSISTTTAIQATGNIRNFQLGISLIFLCELPVAYLILSRGYSPYCAALPSIVTQFIGVFFRFYILTRQVSEYCFKYYAFSVVLRSMLVVGGCWVIVNYTIGNPKPGFLTLLGSSIAIIAFMFLVIYLLGLNKNERKALNSCIRRIAKK